MLRNFFLTIQLTFVHYLSTFYKSSNESGLLTKLRKVDFLESLKNPKFVRKPYIDLDCT